MRCRIPGIFLCVLLLDTAQSQTPDVQEDAKSLIHSMADARRHLRSGVVEIRGTRSSFDPSDAELCYDVPVDADCAFDWNSGSIRYDARVEGLTAFYSGKEVTESDELNELLNAGTAEMVTTRLRTVRTPELFAYYTQFATQEPAERIECDTSVELFDSGADAGEPLLGENHCFDVRSVGLFNFWEFSGETSLDGYELPSNHRHVCELETIISNLLEWPTVNVEREGGLTTIRYLGDLTITLDESRGFTPLHYFDDRGDGNDVETSAQMSSSVGWNQVGNVWVPTTFMIEVLNCDKPGHSLRHTYRLTWSRVNQSIPQHYFDFRDFSDVRDGVAVIDNRSGQPQSIGEWQNGAYVPVSSRDASIPSALTDAEPKTLFWLLITNSLALSLALTGWLLFRRRRSSAG